MEAYNHVSKVHMIRLRIIYSSSFFLSSFQKVDFFVALVDTVTGGGGNGRFRSSSEASMCGGLSSEE